MGELIGILPAAGKGSRLGGLPFSKELFPLPVDSKKLRLLPVCTFMIQSMHEGGAKKIIVTVSPTKVDIASYIGDGSILGIDAAFVMQRDGTKGMPYAIHAAAKFSGESTVLFGMPDTRILPANAFVQLLDEHRQRNADLTLGLFPTQLPGKYGMVKFEESGAIQDIIDKPQSTTLKYMWGIACWEPVFNKFLAACLDSNPYADREIVLGDIFKAALTTLNVHAVTFEQGAYEDFGTVDEIAAGFTKYGGS